MTRRGGRLPRPTRKDEWAIEAVSERVAKDWDKLAAVATNALADAWDRLAANPHMHSDRMHRLKGGLATGEFEGRSLPRWQYEITGGGRIWYLVDDPTPGGKKKPARKGRGPMPYRRVLVEAVHIGHPKETE